MRKIKPTKANYLIFKFDLGFGQYGTIIQKITRDQLKQLQKIKASEIPSDAIVVFDDLIQNLENIVESIQFTNHLNNKIELGNYDFAAKIIDYANNIEPENNIDHTDQTQQKQSPDRLELTNKELQHLIELSTKVQNREISDEQALATCGWDPYYTGHSIENAKTNAELFGICINCGYPLEEDGCPQCNSYES